MSNLLEMPIREWYKRMSDYQASVHYVAMECARMKADLLSDHPPILLMLPGEPPRSYLTPELIARFDEIDEWFVDYVDALQEALASN